MEKKQKADSVGGEIWIRPAVAIPADHYLVLDALLPRSTVRTIRDHWWWCLDGSPSRALFYVGPKKRPRDASPQCNRSKLVTERLRPPHETAQMVFVPLAFAPHYDEGRP